jgi:hypothetical protein
MMEKAEERNLKKSKGWVGKEGRDHVKEYMELLNAEKERAKSKKL